MSPCPQPPRADRVVGGVPGDVAIVLQQPLRGVVEGDALEWAPAHVPLPLDDLQGHRQVPFRVEEDLVAQEGEVDLPEFLKQLEGPDNKEVELASEVGPDPGESDHPISLDLHICEMGAIGLCEWGGLGGRGRAQGCDMVTSTRCQMPLGLSISYATRCEVLDLSLNLSETQFLLQSESNKNPIFWALKQ